MKKKKERIDKQSIEWGLFNADCHDLVPAFMPVFKNLVDLFSNLSPRRQRETEDQRSAVEQARPPPSTPPRARPAGSDPNPFTLLSDKINLTETTSPRDAGIAPLPTVCMLPYLHARPADNLLFGRAYCFLITRPYPISSTCALIS